MLYVQHGGSGLSLSMNDILEMDLGELSWWAERLDTQRTREADAIRKASGKGT